METIGLIGTGSGTTGIIGVAVPSSVGDTKEGKVNQEKSNDGKSKPPKFSTGRDVSGAVGTIPPHPIAYGLATQGSDVIGPPNSGPFPDGGTAPPKDGKLNDGKLKSGKVGNVGNDHPPMSGTGGIEISPDPGAGGTADPPLDPPPEEPPPEEPPIGRAAAPAAGWV